MSAITFHGWEKNDRLPDTVVIDGVPMRAVNGVLAMPGAAMEMEAQERDIRRERFIDAIIEVVAIERFVEAILGTEARRDV